MALAAMVWAMTTLFGSRTLINRATNRGLENKRTKKRTVRSRVDAVTGRTLLIVPFLVFANGGR